MDQANYGQFARICVFCGSSSGKKAIYTETAQELGSEMVKRSIDLVYGGGSIGLMGTVAQAVQDAGGHVVGVIPKALMPKEICGATVGDLVAVDDMHQRKAEMARRADAFVALPGGFGTFEEVLEIITWAQLGIHKKPVGFLNVDGYYDAMLALFNTALDQGFLNVASRNIVVSAPTAAALLDNLKNYAPTVDKSVPELTWETTTGVPGSANKAKITKAVKSVAASYDSYLYLNQNSSARVMSPNWSWPGTRIGVGSSIQGARRGVYSVHAQPSQTVVGFSAASAAMAVMKVTQGAGGPVGAFAASL